MDEYQLCEEACGYYFGSGRIDAKFKNANRVYATIGLVFDTGSSLNATVIEEFSKRTALNLP